MNKNQDPFEKHFEHLEEIADTISEVLQCPVTIEDASHRLIAYSSHKPETDPVRIATIIGRKVPDEVIHVLWREGIIQRLMASKEPIRIDRIDEVGLQKRIAVAIRNNQDILGYIWAMDDLQMNDEQAYSYLLRAASAASKKLLQHHHLHRKQEQHMQDFFWNLLTGELHEESAIRDEALQLGVKLPVRYQIKVLEFEDGLLLRQLERIPITMWSVQRIRIALQLIHQHQLILLCSPKDGMKEQMIGEADWAQFLQQWKQRFGIAPIRHGGGSYRDQYTQVPASYQEALTVIHSKLRFPKETMHSHNYADLGYYRFLPSMAKVNEQHPSAHPSLMKLRRYDEQHHTNLLETLYVYLSQDCNVKQASEMLHVHTNTLVYRMKRASEIGEIDLDSMDDKVTLYLELKLNQWL
ncbi:PucR family transcriptional regulator [Paenibacillus marinisediminis]